MKTQNKQWSVIPLTLLLAIGGVYGSTHITHADANKPQVVQASTASKSAIRLSSTNSASASHASSVNSQSATEPSVAPAGSYSNSQPVHHNLGQARPMLRMGAITNAPASSADFFTSTGAKIKTGFSTNDGYNTFMTDFRNAPSVTGNGATASDWDNYLEKLQSDMGNNDTSNQEFNKLKNGLGEADMGFSLKAMFDPNETFSADHLKTDLNKYGYTQFVPLVDSVKSLQLAAEHPAPKPKPAPKAVTPKSVTSAKAKVSSTASKTNTKSASEASAVTASIKSASLSTAERKSVSLSQSAASYARFASASKARANASKATSSEMASSASRKASSQASSAPSSVSEAVASSAIVPVSMGIAPTRIKPSQRANAFMEILKALASMPHINIPSNLNNPVNSLPSVFPNSSAASASSASSESASNAKAAAASSAATQKIVNRALNHRQFMIKKGVSVSDADLVTRLEVKPNIFKLVEKALGHRNKRSKKARRAMPRVNTRRYLSMRAFRGRRKRIVKLIKPCHMHRTMKFRKNMKHLHLFRRGSRIHVKAIKQYGRATRIQLWNNQFITAEKGFIKII